MPRYSILFCVQTGQHIVTDRHGSDIASFNDQPEADAYLADLRDDDAREIMPDHADPTADCPGCGMTLHENEPHDCPEYVGDC